MVEEVREISGRNMTVILNTGSGKLALTATNGPTSESKKTSRTFTGKNLHKKWRLTKTVSE